MDGEKTYCIKGGYRHKTLRGKSAGSDPYWLPEKIGLSRYYQYAVYQKAAALVRKHGLKSVLDIGCGPAQKLMELVYPLCDDIAGIDSQHVVDYCKKTYNKDFFYADDLNAPRLELGRTFDLIICSDVIEHVEDPDILLVYIKKFSHEGTMVVLSTPERDLLRGNDAMQTPNPEHLREWNTAEFKDYIASSGFTVSDVHILPHMRFNLSSLYLKELLDFKFNRQHTLLVEARIEV